MVEFNGNDKHGHLTNGREDPASRRLFLLAQGSVALAAVGLAAVLFGTIALASMRPHVAARIEVASQVSAGSHLPLRLAYADGDGQNVELAQAEVFLAAEGIRSALGTLILFEEGRRGQASLPIPATLADGKYHLEIAARAQSGETLPLQVLPLEVGAPSGGTQPVLFGATKEVQDSDDSEAYAGEVRSDIWVASGLAVGSSNRFWVRVVDKAGLPLERNIVVELVHGELDGQGVGEGGKRIVTQARTSRAGLVSFEGTVTSQVLRFVVRVENDDATKVVQRMIRLGEMPGSIGIKLDRHLLGANQSLEIEVQRPRAKRPVLIDLSDAQGRWVHTMLLAPEQRTQSVVPHAFAAPGLVTIEAYLGQRRIDPAFASQVIWLQDAAQEASAKVASELIALVRNEIDRRENERHFSLEVERAYLDRLAAIDWTTAEKSEVTAALLARLPRRSFGPPELVDRVAQMAADARIYRQQWAGRLRAILVGGGVLLVGGLITMMMLFHRKTAAQTQAVLHEDEAGDMRPGLGFWLQVAAVVAVSVVALVAMGVAIGRFLDA
jgi:hypothetical protein